MVVDTLLADGVILLLLDQCSKALLHEGDDKVSAKLYTQNRVFPYAGENNNKKK